MLANPYKKVSSQYLKGFWSRPLLESLYIQLALYSELLSQLQTATELSTTILDEFAQKVEKVLKAWHLPGADKIYFDETSRDIVLNGSPRSSHGKGLRSITHAAFEIGLLEFCIDKELPHPGFVILDSPLLAYREPEGDDDDLSETDVQDRFYDYFSHWKEGQIIVIENVTPPEIIQKHPKSQFFSKNKQLGRYGLFPAQ